MSYIWDDQSRKRVLGQITRYLHNQSVSDIDNFSTRLVSAVAAFVKKRGEYPGNVNLKTILSDLRTSVFRANTHFKKPEFSSWFLATLEAEGGKTIRTIQATPQSPSSPLALRIFLDDIDSFQEVRQLSATDVAKNVPLNVPESKIKESIAKILGEPFLQKDWGGEIADLFSTHLFYQGKRLASGFLLKGPAVKGTLTIKYLGKNADQIVRLTNTPLDLYLVQFVGPIAQAVADHLEAHTRQAAQRAGHNLRYCLVDGTDTARLLMAYGEMG